MKAEKFSHPSAFRFHPLFARLIKIAEWTMIELKH